MDLSLFGLAAMVRVYPGHLRRCRTLAADPALGAEMQSFFLGAPWVVAGRAGHGQGGASRGRGQNAPQLDGPSRNSAHADQ